MLIQPWEYGRIPPAWVEPIHRQVDEVWVPSRHVFETFVASGVSPEKVWLVPLGVNTAVFKPEGPAMDLRTGKKFRFLFVGGTIWRKGIDVLLKGYCSAFGRADDVCLVIKDMGANSFYKGQCAGDAIVRLQQQPNAPEILYLTDDLSEQEMARLYRACHCLVHPYRGEGFGLPVAEAAACGLPAIVSCGGATDDFVPQDAGYFVATRRAAFRLDEFDVDGWVLDPEVQSVAELHETGVHERGGAPGQSRAAERPRPQEFQLGARRPGRGDAPQAPLRNVAGGEIIGERKHGQQGNPIGGGRAGADRLEPEGDSGGADGRGRPEHAADRGRDSRPDPRRGGVHAQDGRVRAPEPPWPSPGPLVMKSLLVMQLFRHGAVLQSTPALSALRKSFPGARIHALVCKPFGESLRGNPDVDEILEWDLAGALTPADSLEVESADAGATLEQLAELKDSLRPFRERRFDAVYNLSNNALSALVAYLLRPRQAAGMVFCRDRSYRVRNDWLRLLSAGSNVRSLNVFNRADVLVHACGGDSSARHALRVAVTAADERYAEELLGGRSPRAPIGIQCGAHRDCRRWPTAHFAQLAKGLLGGVSASERSSHDLVFFGSADERADIERIGRGVSPAGKGWLNLAGRTSFGRLAALLKRCRLLVSNDTATAHVAAAVGTPCLVLAFGASNGSETGPYGEGHFILEPRMPCFPCQCGQLCPSLACRERLTPAVALAAVECALSGGQDSSQDAAKFGSRLVRVRAGCRTGCGACILLPDRHLRSRTCSGSR